MPQLRGSGGGGWRDYLARRRTHMTTTAPKTKSPKTPAKKPARKGEAREIIRELQTMRDEIRVKIHLAGMDAKDAWHERLEPRLRELEGRLEETSELAAQELRAAAQELRTHFRKIRDEIRNI
jgi:hypothetical protein